MINIFDEDYKRLFELTNEDDDKFLSELPVEGISISYSYIVKKLIKLELLILIENLDNNNVLIKRSEKCDEYLKWRKEFN